jgi:hypothetical protein
MNAYFFGFEPIGFPSEMIPCKLNHNMICLGFGLLSKGLGTNSKLLTNRNVQFHWNPPIGPLSQMALNMKQIIITNHHKKHHDFLDAQTISKLGQIAVPHVKLKYGKTCFCKY